jgi:putative hemolysin
MIEVGRFCIDPEENDSSVVLTAWAALAQIVDQNKIELLFGCSSFAGIEKEKYLDCFALLRDRYIAPYYWRPKIKAEQVFCYSKELIYQVDEKKALLNMPPLLKTYLSMGAWVSDHAVVDLNMKTLHLFTGVEISKIPKRRRKFLLDLA